MNKEFRKNGNLVITATRIGAPGTDLPFELFGAIDGAIDVVKSGILSAYVPQKSIIGTPVGTEKVVKVLANGDVDFVDLATGLGVRLSCKKIPYAVLLQKIASMGKADQVAYILSNIKLGYTHEDTIAEDLLFESRGIFGDTETQPIAPNDFFDKDQQQSNIIDITEIVELTPATSMSAYLAGSETKVTFNLTMNEVA